MYPLKIKDKYNPANLVAMENTFTTVYLGNYIVGDYGEGDGSHPGVDIIPARPNDDVYACLPGIVQFSGTNASNGNYVVLKHTAAPDPQDHSKPTTLYSCYLHMSTLAVQTGSIIDEGDIIGQTGNTGNSTGEHLHFQMDTGDALFHPYWPFTFQDSQNAGLGFFDAVNKGLGLENARKFTLNPLVYLDSIAGITLTSPSAVTVTTTTATTTVIAASKSSSEEQNKFVDVNARTAYYEAIIALANKNIISGSNGHFYPENNITRAELVKMVFGAGNISPDSNASNPFSDVISSVWYAPYIATAKVKNIIGGYSDGTFRPNNPITRAEALKVIINTLNKDSLDSVSFKVFDDVDQSSWYAPYANFAKINNLLDFSGNSFEPDKLIERAEVANAIFVLI